MSGPEGVTAAQAPDLVELLRDYTADASQRFVDPDAPAELGLRRLAAAGVGSLQPLLRQLDGVLTGAASDDADLARRLGLAVALPAGGSWHAWCRYLLSWLPQSWPGQLTPEAARSGARLLWVSRFGDAETADRATTEVVRVHENALRSWAADPRGGKRLFLRADLGYPVGVVMRRVAGPDPGAGTARESVRSCAVLLGRVGDDGKPAILAAYPEPTADPALQRRFPDLSLLLAGHFGQDLDALDGDRWAAERSFNEGTPSAVRSRAAEQLGVLLAEDDAAIAAAVDGLGCAVRPDPVRRWIEGLRRRITALDWGPARDSG